MFYNLFELLDFLPPGLQTWCRKHMKTVETAKSCPKIEELFQRSRGWLADASTMPSHMLKWSEERKTQWRTKEIKKLEVYEVRYSELCGVFVGK